MSNIARKALSMLHMNNCELHSMSLQINPKKIMKNLLFHEGKNNTYLICLKDGTYKILHIFQQ